MNNKDQKKLFDDKIIVKDKIKRKKKRKRKAQDEEVHSRLRGNYFAKGKNENLNYSGGRKKGAKDLQKRKSIKKWEKEFNQFNEKKKFINKEEYHEYYYKVRKANKKLNYLRKNKAFNKGRLSLKNSRFRSREDFDFYMNKINYILEKDYYSSEISNDKEVLKNNLEEYFGSDSVYEELETLSDDELNEFFDDNFDLKPFVYSGKENNDKLEHISISEDNIKLRINIFKNKK